MDTANAMGQMFYEMISSGQLCPPEERIKFKTPLPKEHFHPFEENGMDFMQAMELTHKALLKWLPIGKETSRFGFEYIKISRMIENAVTTLGRGLMTMRVHGMDLTDAPISIGELLKISSFHFQKSYQGAMAAVNSGNQDAFMRLFTNQLRWLNMLQRLERTRDKLNQPFVPAKAGKQSLPQIAASAEDTALKPLAAPSPLGAPARIGAARALQPIKGSGVPEAYSREYKPEKKSSPAVHPNAEEMKSEALPEKKIEKSQPADMSRREKTETPDKQKESNQKQQNLPEKVQSDSPKQALNPAKEIIDHPKNAELPSENTPQNEAVLHEPITDREIEENIRSFLRIISGMPCYSGEYLPEQIRNFPQVSEFTDSS